MNRKIEEVLRENHLIIEGNYAYGFIQGYEVNVLYSQFDNVVPLKFFVSTYVEENQRKNITETLKKQKIKFLKFEFNEFGLFFGLNGFTANSLAKGLQSVINIVVGYLVENQALKKEYCPICGSELNEENTTKANVEGLRITMDKDCFAKINEEIVQENESFEKAPNNIVKGCIGALLGALAGAVLTVILYFVGFISAISAVVSVLLGSFLYKKMGGKPNVIMIIIVSITSIAMQLLAIYGLYVVAAFGICLEKEVLCSAFQAFSICMSNNEEFSDAFAHDMLLSVVFTVIGVACEIGQLSRSIKRTKQIQSDNE